MLIRIKTRLQHICCALDRDIYFLVTCDFVGIINVYKNWANTVFWQNESVEDEGLSAEPSDSDLAKTHLSQSSDRLVSQAEDRDGVMKSADWWFVEVALKLWGNLSDRCVRSVHVTSKTFEVRMKAELWTRVRYLNSCLSQDHGFPRGWLLSEMLSVLRIWGSCFPSGAILKRSCLWQSPFSSATLPVGCAGFLSSFGMGRAHTVLLC